MIQNQPLSRRSPQQQRAREKVELIFEATVRILEKEGLEALTTNHIAAVAGISIGTLYQYFPDKEAILAELVHKEIDTTFKQLAMLRKQQAAAVITDPSVSGSGPVRQAVRVMLSAFGGRVRARRLVLQALVRSGQGHLLDERMQQLGMNFLLGSTASSHTGPVAPPEPDVAAGLGTIEAFVLARAVSGALRAALQHDEKLLRDPAFEDALCRLIEAYLRWPSTRPDQPQ